MWDFQRCSIRETHAGADGATAHQGFSKGKAAEDHLPAGFY
jgi:hypothetical protein